MLSSSFQYICIQSRRLIHISIEFILARKQVSYFSNFVLIDDSEF